MLDDGNALAVALGALRKQGAVDAEAVAAVLLERFSPLDVARGLTRGLGLGCTADGACALAQTVPEERVKQARQALIQAGMGDLAGGDAATEP